VPGWLAGWLAELSAPHVVDVAASYARGERERRVVHGEPTCAADVQLVDERLQAVDAAAVARGHDGGATILGADHEVRWSWPSTPGLSSRDLAVTGRDVATARDPRTRSVTAGDYP